MIYRHAFKGIEVQTGDLLATRNGTQLLEGQFWRIIGGFIPGKVDHIVVYVGPGTRCVEAGAKKKVIQFEAMEDWDGVIMQGERGFIDTLYGAMFPLVGHGFSSEKEIEIRQGVAEYCLKQAAEHKPYNLNFMNSETEDAFYCSQLAYKAYKPYGINLNSGEGLPNFSLTQSIVFPQEVWAHCENKKV